jgi:hypothetical protein
MERNTQQLIILIGALAFTACTKEIELGLDDQSNKVVIEADVTEGPGPHTVRLSRSVSFSTPNDFPAIANATVTLSDDQGHSEQLAETDPGLYSSSSFEGVPGRTYQLAVTMEGTTYTSSCRMPQHVPLDSVRIDSVLVLGEQQKLIFVACTDPAGVANNYRYVLSVDGERQKGVLVQNDLLEDGNVIEQPLNFMDDATLQSGSVVEVTMHCITPEVYRYFFGLAQNIGGESAAPADPVSNISGGALGYFSAHTASTKSAVVP